MPGYDDLAQPTRLAKPSLCIADGSRPACPAQHRPGEHSQSPDNHKILAPQRLPLRRPVHEPLDGIKGTP
jgi:hypothetical protein